MNINTYLEKSSLSELARTLDVAPSVVYQWAKSVRKVPIQRCHDVVKATDGMVTLQDLRPHDWHLIWPELATIPVSPASAEEKTTEAEEVR